jgi:hypothetical protein
MSCYECYNFLKNKYNIKCDKNCDFNEARKKIQKLYLKIHPDKGGDIEEFKKLRHCEDIIVKEMCVKNENIEDIDYCNEFISKYRKAYKTKDACIKGKKSSKKYDIKCPEGKYFRKGFEVKEKCDYIYDEDKRDDKEIKLKGLAFYLSMYLMGMGMATFYQNGELLGFKNLKRRKIFKFPPENKFYYLFLMKKLKNDNSSIKYYKELKDFFNTNGYVYEYVINKKKYIDDIILTSEPNRTRKSYTRKSGVRKSYKRKSTRKSYKRKSTTRRSYKRKSTRKSRKYTRCPNGSRKNKKTGECVKNKK